MGKHFINIYKIVNSTILYITIAPLLAGIQVDQLWRLVPIDWWSQFCVPTERVFRTWPVLLSLNWVPGKDLEKNRRFGVKLTMLPIQLLCFVSNNMDATTTFPKRQQVWTCVLCFSLAWNSSSLNTVPQNTAIHTESSKIIYKICAF